MDAGGQSWFETVRGSSSTLRGACLSLTRAVAGHLVTIEPLHRLVIAPVPLRTDKPPCDLQSAPHKICKIIFLGGPPSRYPSPSPPNPAPGSDLRLPELKGSLFPFRQQREQKPAHVIDQPVCSSTHMEFSHEQAGRSLVAVCDRCAFVMGAWMGLRHPYPAGVRMRARSDGSTARSWR